MFLNSDQLRTIQDALEFAYNTKLNDYEKDRDSQEILAMRRAVRSARDVKRFSQAIVYIHDVLRLEGGSVA
jgi:hypothetical protein